MKLAVSYGSSLIPKAPEPALCIGDEVLLWRVDGDVVFNVPDRSPAAIRSQLERFKDWALLQPQGVQADMPVEHTLIDGVYTRKLFIKAGTLLVGKIHRKECVNIVAKGDISVLTETGCGRFQAGHVAVSGPGIQKLGYAHEDTVFINVFRTDETDITKIENEIASESYAEVELCLSHG